MQQILQNMRKITIISALLLGVCISSSAQHNHEHDHDHDHDHDHHHHYHDTTEVVHKEKELQGIVVRSKNPIRRMTGAVNGVSIHKEELFKAACCNLGESFTTNPAVDVSYTDAATGAKQIKLLGLSGTYVQMLTGNLPNFRGVAAPYALGYVPGPWMSGIQVSKGSSSVKNGYESITGQINVEYLKPEEPQGIEVNLFGDSKSRIEANATGNLHFNDNLSANLLLHYENSMKEHDDNGDMFMDKPQVEQFNALSHWLWKGDHYILHAGAGLMVEDRKSGQMEDAPTLGHIKPYEINIETNRFEGYMKHAYIFDHHNGTNMALLASASMQEQSAEYGLKEYYVNEKNAYASLVFETNIAHIHNLSAGLSLNHDYLGQSLRQYVPMTSNSGFKPEIDMDIDEKETTPGVYAQYTLNLSHKFTAMAGIRFDHSSIHGTFVTPRFHVKYMPSDLLSLRLSAGKGYRTVHPYAEFNYLLASGREMIVDDLEQEEAWNYGISGALNIPIGEKLLKINAEYYYTNFEQQAVMDMETYTSAGMPQVHITNLDGKSYSHTFQIDATYPFFEGFTVTAAYRMNDVKCTYNGELLTKPLTSKYKGLLTASYKTPNGKWQFDGTLQLNGGGRMPKPYQLAGTNEWSWDEEFDAFEQVSAQITRWFDNWSIYIGGENLTNFKQKNPIINGNDPWSGYFDSTMIWGPIHERMFYAGVRFKL